MAVFVKDGHTAQEAGRRSVTSAIALCLLSAAAQSLVLSAGPTDTHMTAASFHSL